MSNWQSSPSARPVQVGYNLTTGQGTTVDVPDSTTEGAWVELTASTPFDAEAILFNLTSTVEVYQFTVYVTLGIGSVGNERVIIDQFHLGMGSDNYGAAHLPIFIPKGSRLCARAMRSGGSIGSGRVTATLFPKRPETPMPPTRWTVHRDGNQMWQGLDNWTLGTTSYGPWRQFVASCPHPVTHVGLFRGAAGGGGVYHSAALQIGTGGSGSEVVVLDAGQVSSSFWVGMTRSINVYPIPRVPSGTRFAIRGASLTGSGGSFNVYLGG